MVMIKSKIKAATLPSEVDQIEILGQTISIGPGTVPTSSASISQTSISGMTTGFRKASKLGLFELSKGS